MRLRDTLRFSLELVVPEVALRVYNRITHPTQTERTPPQSKLDAVLHDTVNPIVQPEGYLAHLRHLIQDLDAARYGGITFGPDSIDRMVIALDQAIHSWTSPPDMPSVTDIASGILAVAAGGERDPARLCALAVSQFRDKVTPLTIDPTEDADQFPAD